MRRSAKPRPQICPFSRPCCSAVRQTSPFSGSHAGWTAGGGLEYAITDHLSFKTEYLYVDLGKQTLFSGGGGLPVSISVDTHFHSIQGGLNYRF